MSAKPLRPKKSRNADYKLLEIASKFKNAELERINGTCANIKQDIEPHPIPYEKTFGATVSAPYVLARLCAMFPGLRIEVDGQPGYKTTWNVILKHIETNHVLTFYDFKGAISYGSDVCGVTASKTFIQDVKTLIKALRNNRFPHPYDGCVVGEVA